MCLFLSVAHSAGYMRMDTISLPALILLAWFLKAPFKTERILLQALWALTLVLAVARPVIAQRRWSEFLDLPTGRTAFSDFPVLYYKCKWVAERTHPGDYFLDDPQICFALRLRDPSRVPILATDRLHQARGGARRGPGFGKTSREIRRLVCELGKLRLLILPGTILLP